MSWQLASWLLLGGSTVLLFLGLPVVFSFLVINVIGAWLILGGEAGIAQMVRNCVGSVASFSLTPIPLFVLMGEVLFHTGLAVKVIDGIERLIKEVPGRLAVVAVVAGTVFSAISGSTIATTAMLGGLMVPLMLQRAARQVSADVQRRALQLATLLEPLLIVVMGVVVMLIVLAVLLPIIELNQLVK